MGVGRAVCIAPAVYVSNDGRRFHELVCFSFPFLPYRPSELFVGIVPCAVQFWYLLCRLKLEGWDGAGRDGEGGGVRALVFIFKFPTMESSRPPQTDDELSVAKSMEGRMRVSGISSKVAGASHPRSSTAELPMGASSRVDHAYSYIERSMGVSLREKTERKNEQPSLVPLPGATPMTAIASSMRDILASNRTLVVSLAGRLKIHHHDMFFSPEGVTPARDSHWDTLAACLHPQLVSSLDFAFACIGVHPEVGLSKCRQSPRYLSLVSQLAATSGSDGSESTVKRGTILRELSSMRVDKFGNEIPY